MADNIFPIDTDGIIAKDFLCKIDYAIFTLSLNDDENIITFPMQLYHVKLNLNTDTRITSKEIATGVFISNAIVPKSGMSHVRILNINNNEVIVKNITLETEPLENYIMLPYKQKNSDKIFQLLKEKMKINCNATLYNIFKKYQEIFCLEGEPLSMNNLYTK